MVIKAGALAAVQVALAVSPASSPAIAELRSLLPPTHVLQTTCTLEKLEPRVLVTSVRGRLRL